MNVSKIMTATTLDNILTAPAVRALTFTRHNILRLEAGANFYTCDASGRLDAMQALKQTHTRVYADKSNPVTLKSQWVKKEEVAVCPVDSRHQMVLGTCHTCEQIEEEALMMAASKLPPVIWLWGNGYLANADVFSTLQKMARTWVKDARAAGWKSHTLEAGVPQARARRLDYKAEDGTLWEAVVRIEPGTVESYVGIDVWKNGQQIDVPELFADLK